MDIVMVTAAVKHTPVTRRSLLTRTPGMRAATQAKTRPRRRQSILSVE